MRGAAFPLLYAFRGCAGTTLHYRFVEKGTIVSSSRTLTSARSTEINKPKKFLFMIDKVLAALQTKYHKTRLPSLRYTIDVPVCRQDRCIMRGIFFQVLQSTPKCYHKLWIRN